MRIGFKGFFKPTTVENQAEIAGNVATDEFVMWTGGNYRRRRPSGRSACLYTVTEKNTPVPLQEYVNRCFVAAADGKGYPTSISVGGLDLHQGAKPAVYFYLIRDAEGNFRAKKGIPNPPADHEPYAAGDIVIAAPKPKKGKALKQIAKK